MTDTKTLKLFRKQAMATLELDLNIWINGNDFSNSIYADDTNIHDFLTKAIKRKTNGYETYLKLYQDLDGTHGFMNDVITISNAEDYICCYM